MQSSNISAAAVEFARPAQASAPVGPPSNTTPAGELRDAFDQFVGETFFSQLISQMRKTVDKSAYFHGGRGEEVFQGQLDQMFAQRMTEASADTFTGPMFELFSLRRPN